MQKTHTHSQTLTHRHPMWGCLAGNYRVVSLWNLSYYVDEIIWRLLPAAAQVISPLADWTLELTEAVSFYLYLLLFLFTCICVCVCLLWLGSRTHLPLELFHAARATIRRSWGHAAAAFVFAICVCVCVCVCVRLCVLYSIYNYTWISISCGALPCCHLPLGCASFCFCFLAFVAPLLKFNSTSVCLKVRQSTCCYLLSSIYVSASISIGFSPSILIFLALLKPSSKPEEEEEGLNPELRLRE